MRSLREQVAGRCVHFNGVQNKSCAAGICYDSMPKPMPCLTIMKSPHTCEKLRMPTAEEVDAEVAQMQREIDQVAVKHESVCCSAPLLDRSDHRTLRLYCSKCGKLVLRGCS